MKSLFRIIRNNKVWSGVSAVLVAVGMAAYAPFVSVGKTATQLGVETYCESHPEEEECLQQEN